MANKKEEKASPFGCLALVIIGITGLILFIEICGGRTKNKVDTWASVLVILFIILVLIVMAKTKFKSLDDYFK